MSVVQQPPMSPSSSIDEFDDTESPPLPTPTLPTFVDPGTVDMLASLQSFSFGTTPSVGGSGAVTGKLPAYPTSSFPSYCLPRKADGGAPGWDVADLADDDDEVNPSPVYGKLGADGETLQTPGTPIAERERYEYPDPASSSTPSHAPPVSIRPSPTPMAAPASERRGSISLPNVLSSSAAILDGPTPPPSSVLPLQPLHPATSPFAAPGSRRPSLVLAHYSSLSVKLSRSRSDSQPRPSFPQALGSSRASMSHIHPPTVFFPAMKTDAPIPPSLRNHPAFAKARATTANGALPPSILARRGSLPAGHHATRRQNSLSGYTVPSPAFAGVSQPPIRRASLNDSLAAKQQDEELRRVEIGRPRLGSIPSFGSDDSGSSGGTDAGSNAGDAPSSGSTPTQALAVGT